MSRQHGCRIRSAISLIWTILLLSLGANGLAAEHAVSLQLDGPHQFRYAGYYAALWQGYYERAGLKVELLSGENPDIPGFDVISSVIDGDSTFGIAGAELLLANDRGYPVVALAVVLQRSSIDLYIADRPIDVTHPDLDRIGVSPKPIHWLTYELMYNRAATDAVARQVVPLASSSPAELDGVEGMFGDSLIFPYIANKNYISLKSIKPHNHGVDLPGSTIFTSRDVLQNNPDLVEAFVVASLEGWRYALYHSDEIAMRLTRETLARGNTQANFGANFYQIEKVRELTMYPVVPLGNNSAHRWAAAHEQLRRAGLVSNPLSPKQFIYDPVQQLRQRAERNEWWLTIGTPLLAMLALLATFAYTYHWRLQRKAARKLYREANYDSLTGLPNRQFALRFLNDHIRAGTAQSAHLLFIDLDGFKRVNDQFGHAIGDQLLQQAADRLLKSCAAASMVARLGGDEFIAVFRDLGQPCVTRIANRAVDDMKRPLQIDGRDIHIGASIGGVRATRESLSGEELLQRADTAMYHAKVAGKGRYREFDKALHDSALERIELEAELHKAIEDNEFSLCYQPIVALKTGRCIGAEALLRWNSSRLGQVSPERFIPVAEANGMIEDIGAWVLDRACAQWSQLERRHGLRIKLSVNVSPRQFYSKKLLAILTQIERVHGLQPSLIKLEITEGTLANSDRETDQLLNRISRLGYAFSIDDFGTGYASLNYLRQFPASTLKIDRSFVGGLFTDERNQPLVTAIIGMARGLGMTVVAEGVETQAQQNFLQKLECDYAQGYLFSKPLSAEQFSAYLKRQCAASSARSRNAAPAPLVAPLAIGAAVV